ncbi:hypothetical protein D3C84_697290 [compost metagenome]
MPLHDRIGRAGDIRTGLLSGHVVRVLIVQFVQSQRLLRGIGLSFQRRDVRLCGDQALIKPRDIPRDRCNCPALIRQFLLELPLRDFEEFNTLGQCIGDRRFGFCIVQRSEVGIDFVRCQIAVQVAAIGDVRHCGSPVLQPPHAPHGEQPGYRRARPFQSPGSE